MIRPVQLTLWLGRKGENTQLLRNYTTFAGLFSRENSVASQLQISQSLNISNSLKLIQPLATN
ncbi:uncharacterized protein MYCFIDRAFT_173682 [Pseudocercospora fijiensis CIRAD86]|uniref:Uncharacterized protein n=1 Tax=Pseudocercospora fijiensis (strain CIRAD86) TaxID=383855 RepID=M3B5X3_PSEFD|nr:uncharacterized protein MYCFIDRAFT_173682 [Pseudocercospora fijiensis CIRAD86]EME84752.1 hypothetical protein MYCFIDRAFT_173682 [Pseudocercospora fijiensis CIRAD86]